MKAKSVNEYQDFERGKDPKEAMGIGMGKEFLVLSLDAQDNFGDVDNKDYDGHLMQVDGPMPYAKAKKLYDEMAGSVSNMYIVNVMDSDISI